MEASNSTGGDDVPAEQESEYDTFLCDLGVTNGVGDLAIGDGDLDKFGEVVVDFGDLEKLGGMLDVDGDPKSICIP